MQKKQSIHVGLQDPKPSRNATEGLSQTSPSSLFRVLPAAELQLSQERMKIKPLYNRDHVNTNTNIHFTTKEMRTKTKIR